MTETIPTKKPDGLPALVGASIIDQERISYVTI